MPADRTAEKRENHRQAFLGALREHMDRIYILTERGEYDKAVNKIKSIEVTIKKVQEISEGDGIEYTGYETDPEMYRLSNERIAAAGQT